MLVRGPIATSKSSPGAALAASTSLRGAKPAGQRHQMSGQRLPGLQHALCQLGWSQPAAQQARRVLDVSCTHESVWNQPGLASSSSDQMQHMSAGGGVASMQSMLPWPAAHQARCTAQARCLFV